MSWEGELQRRAHDRKKSKGKNARQKAPGLTPLDRQIALQAQKAEAQEPRGEANLRGHLRGEEEGEDAGADADADADRQW